MGKNQRYVSDELTHFIGRSMYPDEEAQYELLKTILQRGELSHPPHAPGQDGTIEIKVRSEFGDMYNPGVVCFCDIPVEDLYIHREKYKHFGLAFMKSFLVDRGASPVFYVAKNATVIDPVTGVRDERETPQFARKGIRRAEATTKPLEAVFKDQIRAYKTILHTIKDSEVYWETMPTDPKYPDYVTKNIRTQKYQEFMQIESLEHFLDLYVFSYVKPFDASRPDDDEDNYYMEREWRVVGNVPFSIEDVRRVLLPEQFAAKFRNDFPDYCGQVTFTSAA